MSDDLADLDAPHSYAVNKAMRSLPLTNKSKPGGRPRQSRAPANAFATWLTHCNLTPQRVAEQIGRELKVITGGRKAKISISSVYNARNAYYIPGRDLAVAIANVSRGKVAVSSWGSAPQRPRKEAAPKVARRRKVA